MELPCPCNCFRGANSWSGHTSLSSNYPWQRKRQRTAALQNASACLKANYSDTSRFARNRSPVLRTLEIFRCDLFDPRSVKAHHPAGCGVADHLHRAIAGNSRKQCPGDGRKRVLVFDHVTGAALRGERECKRAGGGIIAQIHQRRLAGESEVAVERRRGTYRVVVSRG